MSRLFDPVAFFNNDLEENATVRIPNPEAQGLIGQVTKLAKVGGKSDKGDWHKLNCTIEFTDREYLAKVEGQPEKVTMTLGIMLEMNGEQIATGPNKNVRLGKFREACGVNGKPLAALIGQMARFDIKQKPHHEDPEVTVDEIVAFQPA